VPAIEWQVATVEAVRVDTPRVKSFTLSLPDWRQFRPGQHFDIRLTAPDGYQAQRSYSIASPPEMADSIELTVELLEDGEVSPYFHEVVQPGDQFEVRGPIGGPFTWSADMGGPLLLVGGGSGVVPLMSMLRHRRLASPDSSALLLYSSRTIEEVIYAGELAEMAAKDPLLQIELTLTREQPAGWTGYNRRVDTEMVAKSMERLGGPKLAYVCGPTGFVETAARLLVEAGMPADSVRTERFGPTGT
jgi:ferredoxin-NADP reductase